MRRIEKRGEVNVLCDDYGCSPATKAEAEFFDEITRLRAEVASLTAQLQSGESFHAVAVRQRDAAWGEVETLKATLTQQCKGFRADVEKLEAEVEALKAENLRLDAAVLDWLYANGPNGWIEKLRVAVEDLTADRDSWRDQASARAADAVRFMQERDAARAEVEALRADAERYRWLREQHWFDSPICVVVNPKTQLLLGTHCPFGEKLDEKIDAARAAQGGE